MKNSDLSSKILALTITTILMGVLGLFAYLPSYKKGDITVKDFTISNSIRYGLHQGIIVGMVIAFAFWGYLIHYRNYPTRVKYIFYFLLVLMLSFFITIIFVTTGYSIKEHSILSSFIFVAAIIYVGMNSYVLYGRAQSKTAKVYLIALPILMFVGFAFLGLSLLVPTLKKNVGQIFPSTENYAFLIQGLSILASGFIG